MKKIFKIFHNPQLNKSDTTLSSKSIVNENCFTPLPKDVVNEIAKYLDVKSLLMFSRVSKKIHKDLEESIQLKTLLRWVVKGNLIEVEKLLNKNPRLGLVKGDVTDLSARTFENVTAFQLAVWYLDKEMWETILPYLDRTQAALQLDELENHRHDIMQKHGKHFEFHSLLNAYTDYLKKPHLSTNEKKIKQIYSEQLKVPAWYMYSFCEKGKKMAWPTKNFDLKITRYYNKNYETKWFAGVYDSKILNTSFGFLREKTSTMNLDVYKTDIDIQALVSEELRNKGYVHDQSNTEFLKKQQLEQLNLLQRSLTLNDISPPRV